MQALSSYLSRILSQEVLKNMGKRKHVWIDRKDSNATEE
jgi:hypothetical protein